MPWSTTTVRARVRLKSTTVLTWEKYGGYKVKSYAVLATIRVGIQPMYPIVLGTIEADKPRVAMSALKCSLQERGMALTDHGSILCSESGQITFSLTEVQPLEGEEAEKAFGRLREVLSVLRQREGESEARFRGFLAGR